MAMERPHLECQYRVECIRTMILDMVEKFKLSLEAAYLDLDNGNLHKNKRQAFPTTGEVKDSQHFYTLTSEAGLKTTVQQFS